MEAPQETPRLWIKNPLACLEPKAMGGVVVGGGKILELVKAGGTPTMPVASVFEASDHVLLPGLINAHHHFYQTLTRAAPIALDKELFPWLQALYPVWAGLDLAMVRVAAKLALAELLLSGCTLAADHHYIFSDRLSDAPLVEAEEAKHLGMRLHATRGSMDLSREHGGLPSPAVTQPIDTILAESERLVRQAHQTQEGAQIQIALAPCSPFSVTGELMRETAQLARDLGVRLHTHLAETEDENRFCVEKFGCRPLDYLEKVGWLEDRVWLAHGIHFTETEIKRLAAAGVGVCHCPSSNALLGSGTCPTLALEHAGSPVGLGVDGSASSDASNLIQEARHAFFLGRLRYGPARVGHREVLRWATRGSAALLGREDLGEIAPGKQADLALFKLDELRFSGAGDPLAALILCGAHRADFVMVQGRWVVEKGEIPGLDLPELLATHRAAAERLWSTMA